MRKIYSVIIVALLLVACKTTNSVKKEDTLTTIVCNKMYVSYTSTIKAIVDEYCANSCHSAKKHAHDLNLSTYELVKAATLKPSFLGSINHLKAFDKMPKNKPKLDTETIKTITCWIQNGAPNQ